MHMREQERWQGNLIRHMGESKNGVKDAETKQGTWESNAETKLAAHENKSSMMLWQRKQQEGRATVTLTLTIWDPN